MSRVSVGFLLRHPAHWIALGAGSGMSPKAPGTVGTLWAWVTYLCLSLWLTPAAWGWLIGASLLVGWWACTVTAEHAGIADPGFIVWDEVVAFWLILWVLQPASFWLQLAAFGLFRYFDAAKPGPVRWADQAFKGGGWRGGFGIMVDDLVAALCTLIVLALFETAQRHWA
ncbi:MAG: phosphatidylglycerophosphatase A [Leptothrix sp. (in: b-proteobacteria)]